MCVAAALASCGSSHKAVSAGQLGGEWDIVRIDGSDVSVKDDTDKPFLGFDVTGKRVYGSTSCNRLTGMLDADMETGRIDFGSMGSTRMMCRDMQTEQKVLDALGRAKTFKVLKSGRMTLGDVTGKTVMELKKK